jgi:NADPH-dependent 7-cyano-7-deazaguanine reductase QueF
MEWSDSSILKSIKNTCQNHIHIIETSELSFLGFPNQPDYAKLTIQVKPNEKAIELKSVKQYLLQFRNKHISYERILNCIAEDFAKEYQPIFLEVTIETKPRGGISSKLSVFK